MTTPSPRPGPREAAPELIVLEHAEQYAAWLFQRSSRWPKPFRLALTARIEALALDVLDELVQARYQRRGRLDRLVRVNLALERTRHLLRIARASSACSRSHFEGAMRRLDEIGRMLHGWRTRLAGQGDAS